MKKQVLEAFQEPACEHNQTKSVKGCSLPTPGSAAGGCSFDGAQITLIPITDAVHLVHGPIACLGNSWEGRGSLSSGSRLYQYGFTTDLNEQDIIFGGERKVRESIKEIIHEFHPPAIFIYSTCVTALIGEDLDSICKSETEKYGIPIIPVNSPGFVGSKNLGNRLAGEALLDHVIGTAEPESMTPWDINLIGEYNIAGELWEVKDLFNKIGIRILSKITGDGRFHEIRYAHRAKVNMVVCSRALISLARKMNERYNIPYFEGSFYGASETGASLRNIATIIGDSELITKVEKLIKLEEADLCLKLAPYKTVLKGLKAVLYTGGVKSWSIISALQELGIEVVGVGTNKSSEDDIARIKERTSEEVTLIASDGAASILKTVREKKADMIIAGGRNMYLALKERIPFLDINQERHHAYAGYNGLLRLAQQLVSSIQNPVWEWAIRTAPWEEGTVNVDKEE